MRLTMNPRMFIRRGAWLIVALALVAVLALSACGRGGLAGQRGGQGGSGSTGGTGGTGQTTAQTSDAAINDLIQADANLDVMVAALDSANADANIDESAKDNSAQP
jgi:hypothetical protein